MKAEGRKGKGFLPAGLALGTGLLLFLAFPGAAGFWPLAWIALVPLLLAIRNVSPGRAARLGLLAGMVHYGSLLYWIIIVLGRYGNLPLWVSGPAMLLLALYMSGYLILYCLFMNRAWRRNGTAAVWFGPLLWVGLDYVRSFFLSGFPWQDLAYSQFRALLLIQTADLTGHFGITFHIVLFNCVIALVLSLRLQDSSAEKSADVSARETRRAWLYGILPAMALMVLVFSYDVWRYQRISGVIQKSPRMKIAAVQGNIEQDQKWSPAMRLATIETYADLTDEALARDSEPPVLAVWPETALPFLIGDNPYFNTLKNHFIQKRKIWLLAGAPFYEKAADHKSPDAKQQYISYNSAYLFTPAGSISARYDKQHLVPFGEYIPFRSILPLPGPLVENIGDFTSGRQGKPLSCQSAEIGVLICFESIFPELARDWTVTGANLLINITNDAWFGRASAPWQHLSMAVFRAVENRRSLVRSANTGISTFIDPLGRMSATTLLFQPAYLVEEVPLLEERTIFTGFGHYFGLLCLIVCLPMVVIMRSRQ